MEARISLVTLGVADLERAIAFYTAIGWPRRLVAAEGVAFFQLGPIGLSLYPADELADDARVAARTSSDFRGISLGHNCRSHEDVDQAMAATLAAGGTLLAAAGEKVWGGYGGYVADPDGHAWEIAWNPSFPIGEDGAITIPE